MSRVGQLYGTTQLVHDFGNIHAFPRVFGLPPKLFPSLGRNAFSGFEEGGGFIEIKDVAWFEVQPVANMDRDGDLAFGSKGCLHDDKVSGKSKENKSWFMKKGSRFLLEAGRVSRPIEVRHRVGRKSLRLANSGAFFPAPRDKSFGKL